MHPWIDAAAEALLAATQAGELEWHALDLADGPPEYYADIGSARVTIGQSADIYGLPLVRLHIDGPQRPGGLNVATGVFSKGIAPALAALWRTVTGEDFAPMPELLQAMIDELFGGGQVGP